MSLTTRQILALQSLPGVGKQSILKVGNYCSQPIDIADLPNILAKCAVKKKNPEGKGKIAITAQDIEAALQSADQSIQRAQEQQIGILSYYDAEFPDNLRNTKTEDGQKADPPILLFYKGDISALKYPGIAIIGTRNNTPEGEKAGLYLSENFARRGFCIVSGLAIGCDSFAHRGALNAKGKTVAFLAHGLDTVYPAQNKDLAQEIVLNGGLLLSEYDLGTPVSRYNLVARDRLQAGLALATLVIQTGVKGGTMHAANGCVNSGKPLFVVKYKDSKTDNDEQTLGNHMLVKEAGATYITGTDNLDEIAQTILNSGSSDSKPSAIQTSLL